MPFARAAVRLEVFTGVGLGTETVRTHAQMIGSALVEAETAAAEQVLATQAAAEPVEVAAELLVVETEGVNVRFTDGCHEVKLGEVAGCERGNGLHPHDPAYRPLS